MATILLLSRPPESFCSDAALTPPPQMAEIQERLESLRADGGIRSADGRTVVSGSAINASDKLMMIGFLENVRLRVSRLLGLPMEGALYGVSFRAVEGEDGMPAVLHVRVAAGAVHPIQIVAVGPEALQPSDLAERFTAALLRADAFAHGYRERDPPGGVQAYCAPYPPWFGPGAARLLDTARRQDDAETVLAEWSQARLPLVATLAGSFSPYASVDRALSAQLVAWLLDAPERTLRLAALRDALASGKPWTADLFTTAAGCAPGAAADADGAWDLWLLERRWAVLTPGVTTAGLVRRTRNQLLVRPGEPGVPITVDALPRGTVLSPDALIAHRRESWTKAAASAKIFLLQRLASGRDAEYRRMAEAYSAYFHALRRGSSERRLQRALSAAEELLGALERRYAPPPRPQP